MLHTGNFVRTQTLEN